MWLNALSPKVLHKWTSVVPIIKALYIKDEQNQYVNLFRVRKLCGLKVV